MTWEKRFLWDFDVKWEFSLCFRKSHPYLQRINNLFIHKIKVGEIKKIIIMQRFFLRGIFIIHTRHEKLDWTAFSTWGKYSKVELKLKLERRCETATWEVVTDCKWISSRRVWLPPTPCRPPVTLHHHKGVQIHPDVSPLFYGPHVQTLLPALKWNLFFHKF